MASIQLYGADQAGVLAFVPQWAPAGSALPGYDEIDTDGQFIEMAGADVAIALQRAGHGLSPSATAGTVVYRYLTTIINERGALYFASAIAHLMDQDALDGAWARSNRKLDDIKSGADLLEMTQDDNQRTALLSHGDTTRATLDSYRRSARREM